MIIATLFGGPHDGTRLSIKDFSAITRTPALIYQPDMDTLKPCPSCHGPFAHDRIVYRLYRGPQ